MESKVSSDTIVTRIEYPNGIENWLPFAGKRLRGLLIEIPASVIVEAGSPHDLSVGQFNN